MSLANIFRVSIGQGVRVPLAHRRSLRTAVRAHAKKKPFPAGSDISLPAIDIDSEQLEAAKDAITKKASAAAAAASTYWEDLEDKPAAVALGFAGLLLLYASLSVIDTIDSLPLIGGFFEFVGILASGYYAYMYINPDTRKEMIGMIEETFSKISLK